MKCIWYLVQIDIFYVRIVRIHLTKPNLSFKIFQTQLLHQDADNGIIMSTQSLVLQKVTREMVGDYVCRAVNTEGSSESNPVALKIMCK